jgi:hypothetical protein
MRHFTAHEWLISSNLIVEYLFSRILVGRSFNGRVLGLGLRF